MYLMAKLSFLMEQDLQDIIKMETENIELPRQLVNSIRELVKNTKLYQNENEFIMDAIITQVRKHNGG